MSTPAYVITLVLTKINNTQQKNLLDWWQNKFFVGLGRTPLTAINQAG
ncbi:MAG: hypothetical protein ACKE51_02140 [Methylococcaceae bacterium]